MSEAPLHGAATPAGSRRGAESFAAGARTLGRTGLTVSPVAFGASRARDDEVLHRRALADALRGGVNLIDVRARAGSDAGELLVGRMIANLVQLGEVKREQLVVVTSVPAEPDGCLQPKALRSRLETSMRRLDLASIDVVLLHEPGPQQDEAAFRDSFSMLESLASEGTIGWYGVSGRGFAEPPESTSALSLSRLIRVAQEVGGDSHRFGVVRLPLNLFELGAAAPRGAEPSTLDVAARADIGVIAHRPLDAFDRRVPSVVRLAEQPAADGEGADASAILAQVRKLEAEWAMGLGRQLMVGPDENAVDLFRWGQELGPRVATMTAEQWAHVRFEVVAPHLARTSAELLRALDGELRAAFSDWWGRYGTLLHQSFEAIEAGLRTRRRDVASRVSAALDPLLPAPWRPLPLSNKAILAVLSNPVSTVSVGMRQPGYVHDILSLREHPVRLLGASALRLDTEAIGAAMADVDLGLRPSD